LLRKFADAAPTNAPVTVWGDTRDLSIPLTSQGGWSGNHPKSERLRNNPKRRIGFEQQPLYEKEI
jgi:hypothetical protein